MNSSWNLYQEAKDLTIKMPSHTEKQQLYIEGSVGNICLKVLAGYKAEGSANYPSKLYFCLDQVL